MPNVLFKIKTLTFLSIITLMALQGLQKLLQIKWINMAKNESIQNFGMGKRGREKIVECAINPFIPFIEKQGLRGGGEALARRYHDMSSSQTRKTPRRGDIFGRCSYFCFLDIFF